MADTAYGVAWLRLVAQAKQVYPPWCWICQQEIDTTISGRHADGWTLDHLDPVATHGSAVPDISRVRPAHHRCNSGRGKREVRRRPRSRVW